MEIYGCTGLQYNKVQKPEIVIHLKRERDEFGAFSGFQGAVTQCESSLLLCYNHPGHDHCSGHSIKGVNEIQIGRKVVSKIV